MKSSECWTAELERKRRGRGYEIKSKAEKKPVNVVCLCVFVLVCVRRDSQRGQRVSVAPCVAYKLIKGNRGWGNCTPLPTFL